jgi:hypothetical protein
MVLLFMLQITVSTKAGYVNYVQGPANVSGTQTVSVHTPVRTGSGAFAEVLLNPGSYVRLDENSEIELDGVEMPDLAVRLISGNSLIEAAGFDKRTPLTVRTGTLEAEIVADGIYLVSPGKVLILDGKAQASNSKNAYGKNWEISRTDAVHAMKVSRRQPSSLELWSTRRSEEAAHANYEAASRLRGEPNVKMASLFDVWLWSSSFGGYTYLPGYGFRSPYGHQYLAVRDIFVVGGLVLGNDHRPATDKTDPTINAPVVTAPTTPTSPAPRPAPTPR